MYSIFSRNSYLDVHFEGQKKAFTIESNEEMKLMLHRCYEAGYPDDIADHTSYRNSQSLCTQFSQEIPEFVDRLVHYNQAKSQHSFQLLLDHILKRYWLILNQK